MKPAADVWRALSIIATLPAHHHFIIRLAVMGLSSVRAFKAID